MKKLVTCIVLGILAASLSRGQSNLPVYFAPSVDSAQIGELEAASLAVPAQWPEDIQPVDGWQPVYYRGTWDVFVLNDDIAKDLSVKPGSPYYLRPEQGAPILSIATGKDRTDILSVDTWYCRLQLETILVGYVQNANVDAGSTVTQLPTPSPAAIGQSETAAITELRGIVKKTGMMGKSRSGLAYRLLGLDGRTLAFLDVSQLPERIQVEDFINKKVSINGNLQEGEANHDVILVVKSLTWAE